MILQALVEHYEDLLKQDKISKNGWSKVKVTWGVHIDSEGNIADLLMLKTPHEKVSGKSKKMVYVPRIFEVPQQAKRSFDIKSNFLCDNATYILGIDEKGKSERTKKCFFACKDIHNTLLQNVDTPAAKAILNFFKKWDCNRAKEYACINDNWKDLISGGNLLFYYNAKPVTEDEGIKQAWQNYYNQSDIDSDNEVFCMVTGRTAPLAILHPNIKGVCGGQSMGTSLVSFNAPAFCSYGKEQGGNAPVSKYAAFAYTTALNSLLDDNEHTRVVGDTTIVCWVEGGESVYQDIGLAAMFGVDENKGITEQDLSAILTEIQHGGTGKEIAIENKILNLKKHFFLLGVTPNAARLSVRFFLKDSFGNMLKNISQHYERLQIVRPKGDKFSFLPVWKLLSETVNQNATNKTPSPQMAADTVQAILTNSQYPTSLLNGVMIRIRAEQNVTRTRAAIIKAFYLKNKNKDCSEKEGVLEMELNEECTNVPYTLGRLFAVLEQIQQVANPNINSTIKDKYFNSAASTPAHIFPLLVNLAQKHLRKINSNKYKLDFNNQISELSEIIGKSYPTRLNLPEQGAFQLGYYCQTQKHN